MVADDSLLFFKAKPTEFHEVVRILTVYGKASSQVINFDKSDVIFFPHMLDDIKFSLAIILRVKVVHNHGKYLGAPSSSSKNKLIFFTFVKENVYKPLQRWKGRLFSKASK